MTKRKISGVQQASSRPIDVSLLGAPNFNRKAILKSGSPFSGTYRLSQYTQILGIWTERSVAPFTKSINSNSWRIWTQEVEYQDHSFEPHRCAPSGRRLIDPAYVPPSTRSFSLPIILLGNPCRACTSAKFVTRWLYACSSCAGDSSWLNCQMDEPEH